MTSKAKKILIITGLIVCLIITLLANTEASHRENETILKLNSSTTRVFVNTGTKWIIQTPYKLLKPIP
jgi:hypothetical protein